MNRLLEDCLRVPLDGIGRPEQLQHALAGACSRRATEECRLVYLVDVDDLVSCRRGATTDCPAGPPVQVRDVLGQDG